MAKECLKAKHKKIERKWQLYYARVEEIKNDPRLSEQEKAEKLEQLEQSRIKNRLFKSRRYHRCAITGRARGYYRFFGVSRQVLREMAHTGMLPGVTKSSW